MQEQYDRLDFSHFGQWSQVGELLLTSNILALSLVLAKNNSLTALAWQDVLFYQKSPKNFVL